MDIKKDPITGRFLKGNKGPGFPVGKMHRVTAIWEAAVRKGRLFAAENEEMDEHEAVTRWLMDLPNKDFALLFAKIIPKDLNMNLGLQEGAACVLEALQEKANGG